MDIGAYVTGRAVISIDVPPGDFAYPIDWRYMLEDPETHFAPFDDAGLPMKVLSNSLGTHYLPSRMASWALAHWTRLHDGGGEEHRSHFLKAANWFAAHTDGLYYHRYDMPSLGIKKPWLSALSQGQALSVLVRANALTGEDRFLKVAMCAALPLTTSCDNGGVASTLAGTGIFLEEYPSRSGTLNGCLLAVAGLDDLIESGVGNHLVDLRDSLIETVADQVGAWERNGWSLYNYAPVGSDIVPNFNTVRYHCLHVRLLDHFARRTGDHRIAASAERTHEAIDQTGVRLKAFVMKATYRLRSGW